MESIFGKYSFIDSPILMRNLSNILLSLLSGILFSLSWPEIGNQAWLIFIAFVPLFHVINRTDNWRTSYLYSFIAFFLWHILSNWWMWYSTPVGSLSAWMINSMFMAGVISISNYSSKKLKWVPFEIFLAFYWLSFEIFHLFWDLKWPWMNLGHVFANHTEWIQWYEFLGVYGGALWVIVVNGLFYRLFKTKFSYKTVFSKVILTTSILLLPIIISYSLLHKNSSRQNAIKVTIIQPNVDTYTEKFDALSPLQQSLNIIHQLKNIDSGAIVILPETTVPTSFNISDNLPKSIDILLSFSKERNIKIIGGFLTKDKIKIYNSACFIEDGKIIDSRNKIKLLAYAEKIPFDFVSKKWSEIVHKQGGIEKSYGVDKTAKSFCIEDSVNVGALICFESVFSDITAELCNNGAQSLFIISNDDWWLDTPGHCQHFAFARIKAIETRKWIARSANTGISGIINDKGEIIEKSEYRKETIINGNVFLNPHQSFFVRNEKAIRYTIVFVSIILFLFSLILNQKSKSSKA